MIKSEILIYGKELLNTLDKSGEISFESLEEKSKIKGEELKELLKYLVQKNYLRYSLGLFIATESTFSKLGESRIKLLPNGMEVVLGKRDYFSNLNGLSQNIQNQTNVNNSSKVQVAQSTGNNSSINQIQDNSKINILRQIIQEDEELDDPKKKKLFGILEKFNTLKESGENAINLLKQVKEIAIKYVTMFFHLLK